MPKLPGPFIDSREACDRAGYSRPDSLLRAWRAAGLPIFRRASGRNLLAVSDFEKFIEPAGSSAAERPVG